jgi:catechol 2,3-dioxygenase-like lactoylglutathione lyase family enzyme
MCLRVPAQGLDAWEDKLKAAGVAIESRVQWPSGARSFYFRDPAGNSLECAEASLWNID